MRTLLLSFLLFALPAHAATVEELFAQTRAAVESAKGVEFDFQLRGAKTISGHGRR